MKKGQRDTHGLKARYGSDVSWNESSMIRSSSCRLSDMFQASEAILYEWGQVQALKAMRGAVKRAVEVVVRGLVALEPRSSACPATTTTTRLTHSRCCSKSASTRSHPHVRE